MFTPKEEDTTGIILREEETPGWAFSPNWPRFTDASRSQETVQKVGNYN